MSSKYASYNDQKYATPNRTARCCLTANKTVAAKLPHPDEEVLMTEIEDRIGKSHTYKFNAVGIIEKVRSLHDDPEYESDGHLWRTNPDVYAWIQDHTDITFTPCENASGFHNLGDGVFTCTDDACNCRFDKETARKVTS